MGRQDSASCPSTSCYSTCPVQWGSWRRRTRAMWWRGRKGGTTLGTPFLSDPSTYYRPECKSETKQLQKPISSGRALYANCVYCKDHYTGWTTCTGNLAIHFTISRHRSFPVFKQSTGCVRMNHSSRNTS